MKFDYKSAFIILLVGLLYQSVRYQFGTKNEYQSEEGEKYYPVLMSKDIKEVRFVGEKYINDKRTSVAIKNYENAKQKKYVSVSIQPEYILSKRKFNQMRPIKSLLFQAFIAVIIGIIIGHISRTKNMPNN